MIHVCIIGLGLIGGSLGMALRRVRWKGRRVFTVHGVVRSSSHIRLAKKRGAADHVSTSSSEAVSKSDIVVLAVPVQSMAKVASQIRSSLKKGAIVTDVGSVKESVALAMKRIFKKRRDVCFVGAHPLAGSEKSGLENASPKIFSSSVCVIASEGPNKAAVRRVAGLWRAVGAKIVFLKSTQHDQLVALTSHLPHVLSFSLFSQVSHSSQKNKTILQLAAGSFRDMTRIAGSDPDVWTGILTSNRTNVKKSWKLFQREMNRFLGGSPASLNKTLTTLSASKRRWKQN